MSKRILILLFLITFTATNRTDSKDKSYIHKEAVYSLYKWFDAGCKKSEINTLLQQPANQIMEQLLKENEKNVLSFEEALLLFRSQDSVHDDPYLLKEAFALRTNILNLLDSIDNSDFYDSAYREVVRYFPENFDSTMSYEIFFTATGWKFGDEIFINAPGWKFADAMVFKYKKDSDRYYLNQNGDPGIIFNASIISSYASTIPAQIKSLKKVLKHELFHAMLTSYISVTKNYQSQGDIKYNTLFALFDEGIAHYIADGDLIRERYLTDPRIKEYQEQNFKVLSEKIQAIFDDDRTEDERNEAFEGGLYGKYWEKYVSISGLFMAYHIDSYYGRECLIECVKNGPIFFIKKFNELTSIDTTLPTLPENILDLQ